MGFFYGGIGVWGLGWGFSMWILVWVLWWFHPRGIRLGFFVRLGLRYRLLWLWIFK